ncbi:MAG: tRNA (5-methylaminomethyl-2-thiouridine)(34)-methyltransferase MnmD [Rhodobacteraceae bacterium]|nr:tRNA (5-methylaminomethyl-2-thiouridine)(34)-methyltransferase MnmD [Paracoccaceae bacterium]
MGKGRTGAIDWRCGDVPVSRRFDDPYYSLQDGPAEAAHVFLAGNALPARFRPGFRIAELGFGTGLNVLVVLAAFRAAGVGGMLHVTSFEAFPLTRAERNRALAPFKALPAQVLDAGGPVIEGPDFRLEVIRGDARATLPPWTGCADAWFLDGFAPAKNPELWEPALMAQVAAHTAPGGSFATYTAAGHVRRALTTAGFDVRRTPGFGRKRHMLAGRLP